MGYISNKKCKTKREQLTEGFATGVGIVLFGGPIFIVGISKGWLIWFLFILSCAIAVYLAKKHLNKFIILESPGGGEYWWLGGFVGFVFVMVLTFLFMAVS